MLTLLLLAATQAQAQQLLPARTFKDKKVHATADGLLDVSIEQSGNIVVSTATKKKHEEIATFDSTLNLLDVKENPAVPVNMEKLKQEAGAQYLDGDKLVLKDNVLSIGSRFLGMSMDAGTGLGSIVQQGRIVRTVGYVNEVFQKGSYTRTYFEPVKELKLKSDEGRNVSTEFYKSDGEEFLFANTTESSVRVIDKKTTTTTTTDFYTTAKASVSVATTKTYDTYTPRDVHTTSVGKTRKLIEASGDLVVLAKRPNNFKFGKRPSAEDMLPFYYIFKYSSKTADVASVEKFQEPVSRIFTFRKALYNYGGLLVVAVPTSFAGDNVMPKDDNVKHYVVRHITDDGKLGWSVDVNVPSGYTRFNNVIEMKDGSLLLTGTYDEDKENKYYNKVIGTPSDHFYTVLIRDKKVVAEFKCSFDELKKLYTSGDDSKLRYDPGSLDYLEIDDIRAIDSDETIVFTRVLRVVNVSGGKQQKTITKGYLAFHYDNTGKLLKMYGVGNESEAESPLTQTVLRTGPASLSWITFEAQDDEGKYMLPRITRINFKDRATGKTVVASDGDHFVTKVSPMFIDLEKNMITFFGFDKKGKELWWQPVSLN